MKLADWLAREGITAGEFSRRTGLPRVQCYRWADGHAEPSIESALTIVRATNGDVPIVDLIKPAKQSTPPNVDIAAPASTPTEPTAKVA